MSRFLNLKREFGIPYKDSHWKHKAGHDIVIYIPENAETLNDTFTYNELFEICWDFTINNKEFCNNQKLTAKDLFQNMMGTLEWEFPSTWLDQQLNFS
jgi:hypothetical protein